MRWRAAAAAAAVAVALLAVAGCEKTPAPAALPDAAAGTVVLREDTIQIRAGAIGPGGGGPKASYVYVDVENRTAEERLVAVDGTLVGLGGGVLAELAPDELRVPAGGRRAFALVSGQAVEGATGAALKILHATATRQPVLLTVEAPAHQQGVPVKATLRSSAERPATTIIICAFYDARDHLVSRPFTYRTVEPGGSVEVLFDAPPAATKAEVYLGDTMY